MRAEAVSWDDWSASNAPPIVEEDKWHVALAPGEVKIVSLEQLDDLFRLSIVDAETKVWQNGMSEWQPLRIIAGIDDEPAPEPKRTYPKPPSPRSAPPPPRPASLAPTPAHPAPIAFALAPTQPSFVPPAAVMNPFASVPPLVVSQAPRPALKSSGFGRFLVGLAVVAGVSISLYRNGIVGQAAESLHQPALFTRLEAALGGPAFGTLRAVEQSTVTTASASPQSTAAGRAVAAQHPQSAADPAPEQRAEGGGRGATPPVVSLESLTPEKAAARPKLDMAALVNVSTPAPRRVSQANPEASPAAKSAAPAPAKAGLVEKARPAAEKPESELTARERLNAAIGRSMLASPPSPVKGGKVRGKGNADYDPLNPKL